MCDSGRAGVNESRRCSTANEPPQNQIEMFHDFRNNSRPLPIAGPTAPLLKSKQQYSVQTGYVRPYKAHRSNGSSPAHRPR